MKNLTLALLFFASAAGHARTNIDSAFSDVSTNYAACFERSYSAAHLARNSRQTVRQIRIKLQRATYPGDSNVYPMLAIQVKRKFEERSWSNTISCQDSSKGSVICAVECDGGSVEILSRDADGKLVLKNNGVLLHGGCGADEKEETIFLDSVRGGDDIFNLQQTDPARCAGMKTSF